MDFCNLLTKSFSGKVLQPTYPWWLQNAAKEYNSNLWFFLSHFPHLAVLHKDSQMGQDVVWNLGQGDLPTLIWPMCPFVLLRLNHCQKCPPRSTLTITNLEFRVLCFAIHSSIPTVFQPGTSLVTIIVFQLGSWLTILPQVWNKSCYYGSQGFWKTAFPRAQMPFLWILLLFLKISSQNCERFKVWFPHFPTRVLQQAGRCFSGLFIYLV